jgi:hypothetical protein
MSLVSLRTDKYRITKWSEAGLQRLVAEEKVSDRKCPDTLLLNNNARFFVTIKCRTKSLLPESVCLIFVDAAKLLESQARTTPSGMMID